MMEQPHQDVWIRSRDGLKLHGTYFKGDEGNKAVICFHGYTSKGLNDYGKPVLLLSETWIPDAAH